ncbi:MAG: ABC transporter ATP-binding protein [Chloroflexi bacterium]|nr:ABC transporter ATP-binding protein [Chloroflexota bacterium]
MAALATTDPVAPAADEGLVAIRTRGLEKRYEDVVAVRSLDLEVHAGEVFGLLGPNGAGKTTTILMLLGLTEPTAGEARVLGLDPARNPLKVKRHVGYLPDNVGFYGDMTGRQNLRYTARLNGIEPSIAGPRIGTLLERVGLVEAADARVDTYSRGMRQRLGLADALVKDPLVVILDEPTAAIDPVGVGQTLELVRGLADEHGVAVLLSSHLLHQVQQVCDRIAIFVAGDIVAQGTVRELADDQASGAQSQLEVGADGDPDAVAAVLRSVPGVNEVARDPRDPRLFSVTGDVEVRRRVAEALVAAGHIPWQLRSRGMELDEIYQRYFATAASEAAASEAAASEAAASGAAVQGPGATTLEGGQVDDR